MTALRRILMNGNADEGCDDAHNDAAIFWIVNAALLLLLLTSCSYCWRNFLRRRDERAEKDDDKDRTETFKAKLMESFQRNQVVMVVEKDDLVDEVSEHSNHNCENPSDVVANHDDENPAVEDNNADDRDVTVVVAHSDEQATSPPSQAGSIDQTDGCDIEKTEYSPSNLSIGDDRDSLESVAGRESTLEAGDRHAASDVDYDVEMGGASDSDDGVEECETGYLVLDDSKPGSRKRRQVPNCCAICLCPYEVGDAVVWSCNRACKHAFHQECMMDWLLTKATAATTATAAPEQEDQSTPRCPCCRQDFTDVEAVKKRIKKISWAPGSFNTTSIGLR